MGVYLNTGNDNFVDSIRSEIYIDKSELISLCNRFIRTEQKYICLSRPRRFGKSMAVNMLASYYGLHGDAVALFRNLKVCRDESFSEHANQYNCIQLNIQEFVSESTTVEQMIRNITESLLMDFKEAYPSVEYRKETSLVQVMRDVYTYCKVPFVGSIIVICPGSAGVFRFSSAHWSSPFLCWNIANQ